MYVRGADTNIGFKFNSILANLCFLWHSMRQFLIRGGFNVIPACIIAFQHSAIMDPITTNAYIELYLVHKN